MSKKKVSFILLTTLAVIVTVIFANYICELTFKGKNSLKVYNKLKHTKVQLHYNIRQLQFDNARLQKEYFELKNLEPEE